MASLLDLILGILSLDLSKLTKKPIPVRVENKSSRKNDINATIFCVVFVVGFVSLFALLA